MLANANRPWLYGCAERKKFALLPWLGVSAVGFKTLRGILLGRLVRSRQLVDHHQFTCLVMLEMLLELSHLGYPLSYIRALVHSLPPGRETRVVRAVVRLWHQQWERMMPGTRALGMR